jgi:hypothetical protein
MWDVECVQPIPPLLPLLMVRDLELDVIQSCHELIERLARVLAVLDEAQLGACLPVDELDLFGSHARSSGRERTAARWGA